MTALLGTVVRIGTLADGTPRITLDLQCTLAEIAQLGCDPGTPFGLARITQEASKRHAIEQNTATEEKPRGGPLAKFAAQRCQEPEFWRFLNDRFYEGEDYVTDAETAKRVICETCQIESRAELDNSPIAAKLFRFEFMIPWQGSPHNHHRGG